MGRPLKLETHNVCGLRRQGKIHALARGWVQRGSHIICLQETHVGFFEQGLYSRLINSACRMMNPQHPGFHIYWGVNTSLTHSHSGGVAIMIHRGLITSGELAVHEDGKMGDHPSSRYKGRFLKVPVSWLGNRVNLVCVHLPNVQGDQVIFMQQHLASLATEPGFWGGDFNFVLDTFLDRLGAHLVPDPPPPPPADPVDPPAHGVSSGSDSEDDGDDAIAVRAVRGPHIPRPARIFSSIAPSMIDCFRLLHPQQRSFTWHGVGGSQGSASRIDRWHCSSQFVQYVVRCGAQSPSPSDHRPLVIEVLPACPATHGKGYRRARPQHFWGDEQGRADFQGFVETLYQEAPSPTDQQSAAALLQWWPSAKRRILHKCTQLTLQVRAAQRMQVAAQDGGPAAELEAAYAAVETHSSPAMVAASIKRVLVARQAWRAATKQAYNKAEWQARRDWVHSKEQPSKGLTAVLQSQLPPQSKTISGLVSPATGRLVTEGRPMAQLMATYQANISKASPRDPPALQRVLAAVEQHSEKLTEEEAEALGALEIREQEVRQALKRSKPGKAPGLDGLPVELFRRCGDVFAPLLAKVYTAMGMTNSVPRALLDGVITSIYKKGQRADPANYRPITVLNSDYRVLAKVLANRLTTTIGKLIHPMQSGFVPGRLIGENILLNQMLPTVVGPESMAATVYCDFRKAYDTVDRSFLFAVMEAQGVGAGFIKWVKLLLTHTSACAVVNGHLSSMVAFTAGVRQGCPLAPYLYLFVTQALYSFLKQQGFGVHVGGMKLTACMYADDNQSYISNLFTELQPFKQALTLFHQASGEGVNFSKSHILPIGRKARARLWLQHFVSQLQQQPPLTPAAQLEGRAAQLARAQMLADKASVPPDLQLHGFRVVDEVVSLGIHFKADGTVAVDWHALLGKVKRAYNFISRPPLSMFGRGFASSGYGISKLLYAAEFAGLPPQAVIEDLVSCTAKLVDRGLAPDAPRTPGHTFAGVRKDLLAGHPSTGGFGVMAWEQHILARHAMWAFRLMQGDPSTPWVHVARTLLCPANTTCAAWQRLGIAVCTERGLGPSGRHIHPCLDRLAAGLRALPKWHDGAMLPLRPGSWCGSMPLWCNPFILRQGRYGDLPARGLEAEFADLANIPCFCTLQHALQALAELRGGTLPAATYQQFRIFWLGNSAAFSAQDHAYERLQALVNTIPRCWKAAVNLQAHGLPSSDEVVTDKLLPRLAWSAPRSRAPLGLAQMRVKVATRLQLGPLLAARASKHVTFLEAACCSLPIGHDVSPDVMLPLFKSLWALPWDNCRKEFYWQLTLDAVPTAAHLHQQGEPCNCGAIMPDRVHHFWECPVAQAVREEIETALNHDGGHYVVQRHHLWLCRRPSRPDLHLGVWQVVCLAALLAMNKSRKLLVKWRIQGGQGAHHQDQRPPPALPQRINVASRVARTAFWDYVQDFVSLGQAPAPWVAEIMANHPFIQLHTVEAGNRVLQLHKV
jgi:exonuclease III